MGKAKDDICTGMRYGDWTVRGKTDETSRGGSILYRCVCACGTERMIESTALRRGKSRSCGCARRKKLYLALHGNKNNLGEPGQTGRTAFLIGYKANAKSRNISWELTDREALGIAQLPCAYCGKPPSHFYKSGSNKNRVSTEAYKNGFFLANGLDRKNPHLGYLPGNVVAACQRCNEGKMDLSEQEFASWILRVLEWGRKKGWINEAD